MAEDETLSFTLAPRIDLYRLKSWLSLHACPVVAIAHRITKAVYYIIKHGRSFVDLGEKYLLSKSREKSVKMLKMKAKHLGCNLVPLKTNWNRILRSIQKWSPWERHKYDRSAKWTTNYRRRPRKWNYDNTRLTLRFHTLEPSNINTDSLLVKGLWICDHKEIPLRVSNEYVPFDMSV